MAEIKTPKDFNHLTSITPIDGRFRGITESLSDYFSEYADMRGRLEVEIRYLLSLSKEGVIREFNPAEKELLEKILKDFNPGEAEKVWEIDLKINHDTKAVEYYLKDQIKDSSLKDVSEFLHFALASTDTDNLAFSLSFKRFLKEQYFPLIDQLIEKLATLAEEYVDLPMLARTHGQPAVPTTVGKEIVNFAIRIRRLTRELRKKQITGKLNGAVGNFNAHSAAFPDKNWPKFSADFVGSLGLEPNNFTTQIEPYDRLCEILNQIKQINTAILDLDGDMWRYISDNYFVQRPKEDEVGSSTMPQKVNPIDFERSEATLKSANGTIETLTRELPINRLQRSLTDKYLLRYVGNFAADTTMGVGATIDGLGKIYSNKNLISSELNQHWEIVTEGIQTILRSVGFPQPYEALKAFARGRIIGEKEIKDFIKSLDVKDTVKEKLRKLSPKTYIGEAEKLVKEALKEIKKGSS